MINPCLSETCSTVSSGSKAIPPIAKTSPPMLARRTWGGALIRSMQCSSILILAPISLLSDLHSWSSNNGGFDQVHLHHPLQLTPCLLIPRSPPHFQVAFSRSNTWGSQSWSRSPGALDRIYRNGFFEPRWRKAWRLHRGLRQQWKRWNLSFCTKST